jgi:hypothetical protein
LFASYLLCALIVTWPLIARLDTHLPLGSEQSATVPLFNLWTLRWNVDQLRDGYTSYWDAPIFHPTRGAFALSEPQPLTGLIFALPYFLTGNQVLAYNIILLLILTLNGAMAYALLRRLNIDAMPAWLGGVLAIFLPFVGRELGVLQLSVLFPIFLGLSALIAFADRPTLRGALAMGGWFAVTFLACEYYALFLSVFLATSAPVFARRDHFQKRAALYLFAGVALIVFLLLPIILAQRGYLTGYTRSPSTIATNSAQAIDYLRLDAQALGRDAMPWLVTSGGSGQRLYPGTGLIVLALLGGFDAWRRRRRWAVFCIIGVALAILISLGLNLYIGEWQPYQILRAIYPGFQQLRSPFRMGVFVQIFLIGLAGFGLSRLWRWRKWLALGCVALSVIEVSALPTRLYEFPQAQMQQAWIDWLKTQPDGVTAIVPFPASGRTSAYQPTAIAMLQALEFDKPLANGYSGFFPRPYERLRRAMQSFPNERSLALLREAGVTYLVVSQDGLSDDRWGQLRGYRMLFIDAAVSIYRLAPN